MRVDFYQLGDSPVEAVLPLLAARCLGAGERLLVVAEDADLRARLSAALWEAPPERFLAHGAAGGRHDARQPILLAPALTTGKATNNTASNAARFVAFADGVWREPEGDGLSANGFARAFLLFDAATLAEARELWRMLGARAGTSRHYWRQDGGRWREMAQETG